MYGPASVDPVVEYYDTAFGISGPEEVRFYRDVMRRHGGPVLDLCGGTGRFSILAAKDGFDVTYVDASPGMISMTEANVAGLEEQVRSRIEIVESTMSDFRPRKSYGSIIAVDSFFHNLSSEHARRTLGMVAECLRSDGMLAFNIHFSSPTFLCYAKSADSNAWKPRGRYPIPDTDTELEVSQTLDVDFLTQIVTTNLRFTILAADDSVLQTRYSSWQARYFNRFEIEHLIELSGLVVDSCVGHYDERPVDENGQLIFRCRRSE